MGSLDRTYLLRDEKDSAEKKHLLKRSTAHVFVREICGVRSAPAKGFETRGIQKFEQGGKGLALADSKCSGAAGSTSKLKVEILGRK